MPIPAKILVVTLLVLIGSTAGAQTLTTLMRVTIQAQPPVITADAYRAAGFDVLEGSVSDSSFDLVLSQPEFDKVLKTTPTILNIEYGRPLKEIVSMGDASRAIPAGYLDLAGINQAMINIAANFPAIAQYVNLTQRYGQASTFEGRHLFALKISDNVNSEEDEPAIMLVSNHHAREIITPVIALDAMTRLTSGYGVDPQITDAIDNNEIWIAANWNPDGYNEVVNGDNFWRKNRRVLPGGIGVDQNRNYPQGWNSPCGGSTTPSSQVYRGTAPASEPETQTMIVWSQDQRFAKVIDYHSSGREVLYGYSCSPHPFTSYFMGEAIALSNASGYFGDNRPAGAEGEHYQWQLAQQGAWSHLIETAAEFQPSFASATMESDRVWPGILHAIERPIPVTGLVTNLITGNPVRATVTLPAVNFTQGETNRSGAAFGRYHLFAPPGTYTVLFAAPGYFSQSVVISVQTGQTVERDIQLISTVDSDGDGTVDALDNCYEVANPNQIDIDQDGYGNACDGDFNNDCETNFVDLSLMSAGFFGTDINLDLNIDGAVNFADLAILARLFFMEPGPSFVSKLCR